MLTKEEKQLLLSLIDAEMKRQPKDKGVGTMRRIKLMVLRDKVDSLSTEE